jgi:hypothetical protein
MPKYFSDERPLPYERIDWCPDEINPEAVTAVFSERQSASFCIRLPGLPASCLGYVVNIERVPDGFDVIDITGKKLLSLASDESVALMLKHAAGIRIDDAIRERLLRVRDASG